jgi:hypothetical protein
MHRLTLATLAFVICFFFTLGADAQIEPCEAEGGDVTCPKGRYQLLRDKTRVGELLCQALDNGSLSATLPTDLQAVCESADLTSRIWAKAQTWQEHRDAAQEAQRAANVREGRIVELERSQDNLLLRVEEIAEDLAVERSRKKRWRLVAVSAGGLAALSGVALTGDIAGWWDL